MSHDCFLWETSTSAGGDEEETTFLHAALVEPAQASSERWGPGPSLPVLPKGPTRRPLNSLRGDTLQLRR